MITLPGYAVTGLLYESQQSRIYRGNRLEDGLPVIFKILNEEVPSPQKRARFQQEYRLMRKLQSDSVLHAHGLESYQGTQVMIVEDFGGTSLNNLYLGAKLPLREWLQLAIRIVACLRQLHQHSVMHKDINPANIVWNRKTDQIKLIDLGIATELTREVPDIRSPDRLEGTLAYLSPEQTGRMNRAMDYRTDFYSLGVTFYELLSNQLPFTSGDAMELVHAHIARAPIPVNQVRLDIPMVLAEIVAKMMGKTAEQRYQSASGLQADLQRCLDTLAEDGDIPPFELGRHDFSGRLQVSQKLYGRDAQIATLLDVFERASQGPAELLLVAGYSGIGKSALVHETQKPIMKKRGFFIEGKFDQIKRDIPYASLNQAFRELVQQILTEGDDVVAGWKDKLLHALGNNGQVIVDVIPSLELIIGPQQPVLELPAAQGQNRFNNEFRNFVRAVASSEHPLVIFLDDLQWADLPSLQLISLLLRPPAMPHLLVIGAYRDHEITAAHWLPVTLAEMAKTGAAVHTLNLPALNLDQATLLLSDTLHAEAAAADVAELASLCFTKTQGNPFFLNQFLGALVDHKILSPDTAGGGWRWDIDEVRQADITDNIVDLMIARLHKLPGTVQRVLQGAACLGNVFDLRMLACICALPEIDTANLLWCALQEELIVPLDDRYKYVGQHADAVEPMLVPNYRFLHDRVQQAAYLLSDAAEKSAMHLAIGRLWLKSSSASERQDRLFDLVNHLNLGQSSMTDPQERLQLAQLNLGAARRAKASAAYKPALVYLEAALQLVVEADWERHYELMLALHLEAAEAAYLCADLPGMERTVAVALRHARDLLDQAKIHEIRIQAFITQEKYLEVVSSGLDVLRLLGISFPKNPTKLHVMLGMIQTRRALAGKSMEDLALLPDVTDARIVVARKILTKITSAAYYVLPRYYLLLQLKAIRLSLQYGHAAPASATDFATYGLILGGALGQIEQCVQYGQLGMRLLERPGMSLFKSRIMFTVNGGIHPWKIPLQDTLEGVTQAYLAGVEVGDMEFAGNSAILYLFHAFYCGVQLSELERDAERYFPALVRPASRNVCRMVQQVCLSLMGQPAGPGQGGAALDHAGAVGETQQMRDLEAIVFGQAAGSASKATMFQFASTKMILSYLYRDFHEARINLDRAEKLVGGMIGSVGMAMYHFYGSLIRSALLENARGGERRTLLRKISASQKKLRHWSHHGPCNFLHKWHLVEAELARHAGQVLKANSHYEQAMHLARENNFLHEEALCKELAGVHYLAQGIESAARMHMAEAQQGYRRWGALGKVKEIASRYPQWLADHDATSQSASKRTIGTVSMTSASTSGMLDFTSVMKASQAVSQEIVLDRLLKRLIHVAVESAGAQRGILLLKKDKQWLLEAEKAEEQIEATVLQSIVLQQTHQDDTPLPLSLFHYVVHTRESIVIQDASREKLVANDPYVLQRRPKSLLIVPILHHGEMTGILYLENNAVSGAFTENRLEVLHLMASQAAISIENARLYADMEERIAERTAELKAMSLRDGLTGVANRRAFDERLQDELARSRRTGRPVSLLIIDIDHFKLVNDRFGHPVGDACLKLMGAALTGECRRAADFVARYGGEEFVLLLPDTNLQHAVRFAELVRSAVQKIVLEVGDVRHPITASIGVAEAKGESIIDAAALVANADQCLYAAKAGGRNRVVSPLAQMHAVC